MSTIDNDETKNIALPFVILAHERSGGTFCAHALSNHPQIFCDRSETMHHLSIWRQNIKIKPGDLMRFIWAQTGYHAAGFRLIYRQAFHKRIWPAIVQRKAHVIHLRRRSLIRQALSSAYNQMVRYGQAEYHPVHSFNERLSPKQELSIKNALYFVRKIAIENERALNILAAYPGEVLEVFYEDMVGDVLRSSDLMNKSTGYAICQFLGVELAEMPVHLRRDHPVPTCEMFSNWEEIEKELRKQGFAEQVDYDLEYWRQIDVQ